MNIEEIDRIDAQERYHEMKEQLDQLDNSDNDYSDIGHHLDVDLSYSDGEDVVETTSLDNSQRRESLSEDPDKSYAEEQELEELKHYKWQDESDTVLNLVRNLTERNADYRALELRYNHVKLQNDALSQQERALREDVHRLEFEGALAEENLILLEEKLRKVSSFEDGDTGGQRERDLSLDALRGRLLAASTGRIQELEDTLQEVRTTSENSQRKSELALMEVRTECAALREECESLSTQLAQRTVLYSAQERRYHNEQRMWAGNREAHADEIIYLRARVQQLEAQCAQLDRERISAVLECRELKVSHAELVSSSTVESTRLVESEQELLAAMDLNRSLQETISRLRGADVEDIEREMAQEVEEIRHQAQQREEELRKQLEDAREMLRGDGDRMESLVEENSRLRERIEDVEELLREIKDHSGFGIQVMAAGVATNGGDSSSVGHESIRSEEEYADVVTQREVHVEKDKSLSMLLGNESDSELISEESVSVKGNRLSSSSINKISSPIHFKAPTRPKNLTEKDELARAILLRDLVGIVLYTALEKSSSQDRPSSHVTVRADSRRAIVRYVLGLKAPRVSSPSDRYDGLNGYDRFSLTADEEQCVQDFAEAVDRLISSVPEAMLESANNEVENSGAKSSWSSMRDRLINLYLADEDESVLEDSQTRVKKIEKLSSSLSEAFLTGEEVASSTISETVTTIEQEVISSTEEYVTDERVTEGRVMSSDSWTRVLNEINALQMELQCKDVTISGLEEELSTLRDALNHSTTESKNLSVSIVDDDREEWKNQMKHLDDRSRDLEKGSLLVLQKLKSVEKDRDELIERLEEMEQQQSLQLARLENEKDSVGSQVSSSSKEALDGRLEVMEQKHTSQLERLESEKDKLRAELSNSKKEYKELEEKLTAIEQGHASQLGSVVSERDHLKDRLQTFQAAIQSSSDRMQSLEEERESLQIEISELKRGLAQRVSEVEKVEQERDNIRNELDQVKSSYASERLDFQTKIATLEEDREDNISTISLLKEESSTAQVKLADIDQERGRVQKELDDLQLEYDKLQDRVSSLEDDLDKVSTACNYSSAAHTNVEVISVSSTIDHDVGLVDKVGATAVSVHNTSDIEKLKEALEQSNSENDALSAQIETWQQAIDGYVVRIEVLERERDTLAVNLKRLKEHPDDNSDTDEDMDPSEREKYGLMTSMIIENFETAIDDANEKLRDIEKEIQLLSSRCEKLQVEKAYITAPGEKERIIQQIVSIQSEVDSYELHGQQLTIERDRMTQELHTLLSQLRQDPSTECSLTSEEVQDLQDKVRHTMTHVLNLEIEKDELSVKLKQLQRQMETPQENCHPTDSAEVQEELKKRLQVAEDALKRSQDELSSVKTWCDDLVTDLSASKEVCKVLEEKLTVMEQGQASQLGSVESERDHLKDRLHSIEDDHEALQIEVSELKRDLAQRVSEGEKVKLDDEKSDFGVEKKETLFDARAQDILSALQKTLEGVSAVEVVGGEEEESLSLLSNEFVVLVESINIKVVRLLKDKNYLSEECESLREQLSDAMAKHDELVECIKEIDEDRDSILQKIDRDKQAVEKETKGQIEALESELSSTTEKYVTEKCRVTQLSDELDALQAQLSDVLSRPSLSPKKVNREMEELKSEREKLVDDIDRLTVENSRQVKQLEEENYRLCDVIQGLEKKNQKLLDDEKEQKAEFDDEKEILVDEIKSLQRSKAAAERDIEEIKKKVKHLEIKNSDLVSQIRSVEEEREVVVDELRRRSVDTVTINTLQRENQRLSSEGQSLRVAREELEEQIRVLEGDKKTLLDKLTLFVKEYEQLQTSVGASRKLNAEIGILNEKLESSASQIQTLEDERMALKRQLRGTWTRQVVESSDDLSENIESLKQEYHNVLDQLKTTEELKNNLTSQNEALVDQVIAKDALLAELSAKVEALSTLQNQVNDVAQIDEGINAEERKALEDEVESLRCREAELTNQIDELTKEVEGATAHWRDEMSAAVKHIKEKSTEEASRAKIRMEAEHVLEIEALNEQIEQLKRALEPSSAFDSDSSQLLLIRTELMDRENVITKLQNQLLDKQNLLDRTKEDFDRRVENLREELKTKYEREYQTRKEQLGETSQKVLNDRIREISHELSTEKDHLIVQLNEKNQTIAELTADMRGYGQKLQDKWKEARRSMKEKYHKRLEEAKKRYAEEVHALVNLVKSECMDIFEEVERSSEHRQQERAGSRFVPSHEQGVDGRESESSFHRHRHSRHSDHEHQDQQENFPPAPPPRRGYHSHTGRRGADENSTLDDMPPVGREESLLKSQSTFSAWARGSSSRLGESLSSRRSGIGGLIVAPEMLSPEETQELVRSILSRSTVTSLSVHESNGLRDGVSVSDFTGNERFDYKKQQAGQQHDVQSTMESSSHYRHREDCEEEDQRHLEFVRDSRHHNIPHSSTTHQQRSREKNMGESVLGESSSDRSNGEGKRLLPPSASFSPSFHKAYRSPKSASGSKGLSAENSRSVGTRERTERRASEEVDYEFQVGDRMQRMIAKLEMVQK